MLTSGSSHYNSTSPPFHERTSSRSSSPTSHSNPNSNSQVVSKGYLLAKWKDKEISARPPSPTTQKNEEMEKQV